MDYFNIIPLCIIVAMLLIVFICKIIACRQTFGKETFSNDATARNRHFQHQVSVVSQVLSPTPSSVSNIITISGLLSGGPSPRILPSPAPVYEMPPSYDVAIMQEKPAKGENKFYKRKSVRTGRAKRHSESGHQPQMEKLHVSGS